MRTIVHLVGYSQVYVCVCVRVSRHMVQRM